MPSLIPAMRGKFGSTEYFVVRMPAKELTERLTIPKEIEGWDDLTIEERWQREINYNRVKKHIAPYLASDPDRFFGALIVDILNCDRVTFESISDVVSKLPELYRTDSKDVGFLVLSGEEVLVPLDGQHRLVALRFAMTGKDNTGKEIADLEPNNEVARDTVTVIMVKHDSARSRKIFNKVNRYAKPTSKAENLITADDDIFAVLAREVSRDFLDSRIVNIKSNTINKSHPYFTTLGTIYDINQHLLIDHKFSQSSLPSKAEQTLARQETRTFWEIFLKEINLFVEMLADQSESSDERRRELRGDYLLGKPIAQYSVARAVLRLRDKRINGKKVDLKKACSRMNDLDWAVSNPTWQKVLMNGDNVVSGKTARDFAGDFIAYMAGDPLDKDEVAKLTDRYRGHFAKEEQEKVKLPSPIGKDW